MIALIFQENKVLLKTEKGAALLAPALYMPTNERIQARAMAYAKNPLCQAFFALNGDVPVGLCIVQPGNQQAEILALAVAEEQRKQGIGRRMIAHVHTKLMLPLIAETDDDAVGFYRRCGFSVTSLGEKYPGIIRYRCILSKEACL